MINLLVFLLSRNISKKHIISLAVLDEMEKEDELWIRSGGQSSGGTGFATTRRWSIIR